MAEVQAGYSLAELVARLGGDVIGDGTLRVTQIATLAAARPGQIAFLANPKYRKQLAGTQASAVIVPPSAAEATTLARIVTGNPYAYFARVAQLFNPQPLPRPGIHPLASVGSPVPASVEVGPQVSIAAGAKIGEGVILGAGCVIGEDVEIGEGSMLYPRVVVYPGCRIGKRAIIHSGAVIGADGFGFAREGGAWIKIPQTGRVLIGDDVEIGANTTIDRGALDDTVIGNGVKLDNQIQIAHNVVIGDETAIAGCAGIAGSTKIGRRCTIAGAANIVGHIDIADGVHVSAATLVSKSLKQPGQYTGVYPYQEHGEWLRTAAQIKHLDSLAARVRELEQKLSEMEKK